MGCYDFSIADPDPQSHSHIVPSMSIQYCTRVAGGLVGQTLASMYESCPCVYTLSDNQVRYKRFTDYCRVSPYRYRCMYTIKFMYSFLLLQCETNHAIYCSMFLGFSYGELLPAYSWLV